MKHVPSPVLIGVTIETQTLEESTLVIYGVLYLDCFCVNGTR